MSYSDQVKQMGEVVKGQMTVGENGVVDLAEGAFEKTLEGTDLTLDDFKKTQDHRDLVIAGIGLGLGELGIAEFKKNKDLGQVSAELKIHRDSIGGTFHRSRNLPDGDGGMKEKKGVLSMSYKANGQMGSKGSSRKSSNI